MKSKRAVYMLTHHLDLSTHANSVKILGVIQPGGGFSRGSDLATTLTPLSRLASLTTLKLADAAHLNLGFYPPRCGNAYSGSHGGDLLKSVDRQRQLAQWKAVEIVERVFAKHERLEKIHIGHSIYVRKEGKGWVKRGVYSSKEYGVDEVEEKEFGRRA